MKNYLVMLALLFGAMFTVGCNEPEQPDDKPNITPGVKPEVTLEAGDLTETTFTFTIESSVPGEYAYYMHKKNDDFDHPAINDWFKPDTSGPIEDRVEITLTELVDDTEYDLFVVVRATEGSLMSDVKKLSFTTLSDGKVSAVEVESVSYNSINFTINLEGDYLFSVVAAEELTYYNMTAEDYVLTYGIYTYDPKSYEWIDGGSFEGRAMHVKPGREYTIIAVNVDNGVDKNVIGEFHMAECQTPAKPQSTASVAVTLSNITSTSVTIATEPDENVASYYVYVNDKEWVDMVLDQYGTEMLCQIIVRPSAGSWNLTTAAENTWTGLVPSTETVVMTYVIDNAGAVALSMENFTTADPSAAPTEVDAELVAAEVDGHKTLKLNIVTDGTATSLKYAFNTTADVDLQRDKGLTDATIAANFGLEFNEEQLREANSTGVSITLDELWPEVEYTALVLAKNAEYTETVSTVTFTTEAQPVPARVESDLFTSLLGEWSVSYEYIDYMAQSNSFDGVVVTIAAGVDEKTNAEYRAQNRLVILDWPFQPSSADGEHITTYTPQDLMNTSAYWSEHPALAYRDYGPKIFLEIGAGDRVGVPSSKNTYFYNWDDQGNLLNFYGCDYDKLKTAPTTFPVEIRDGGDTIVIGAHQAGAEYGYGLYRPAVFRNNQEAWCVATSDIILRRVK